MKASEIGSLACEFAAVVGLVVASGAVLADAFNLGAGRTAGLILGALGLYIAGRNRYGEFPSPLELMLGYSKRDQGQKKPAARIPAMRRPRRTTREAA